MLRPCRAQLALRLHQVVAMCGPGYAQVASLQVIAMHKID